MNSHLAMAQDNAKLVSYCIQYLHLGIQPTSVIQ